MQRVVANIWRVFAWRDLRVENNHLAIVFTKPDPSKRIQQPERYSFTTKDDDGHRIADAVN
jgi:hypothetical protein